MFYLICSCHIRWGWYMGHVGGGGSITLQPLYHPCNLLRCVWCTSVLGPKWVSTIIDILNNYYNWSRKYPYEALPQPVSPCVLGLCFITFKRVWVIVPNMTLYLLFGPFLSYEMGGDIRVILGVLPSNPHITLATSWDVFGVPTCWGLSGFQQS